MDDQRIDELAALERSYWWHVGRRAIIRTILDAEVGVGTDRDILDVGCGTGVNVPLLTRYGRLTALDVNERALDFAKQQNQARFCIGDFTKLPFPEASFDLVTSFDVLEHVADDERALAECFRVLRPGGFVFLLTPAYPFLWSEHDEALGHVRRYTLSELHRKLDRAGFQVLRRTYCITFLLPVIVLYRFLRSLLPRFGPPRTSYLLLPKPLNEFGVFLLKTEAWLLRYMNFPFGVTNAVFARKSFHGDRARTP